MQNTDPFFQSFKDVISASNPGLITLQDLQGVERRLDELEELMAELEARHATNNQNAKRT
jgi:hypothetical protein